MPNIKIEVSNCAHIYEKRNSSIKEK
jgi:hypothetical protein